MEKYSFELQKDDFLSEFMKWKDVTEMPETIEKVAKKIEKISLMCENGLAFILCFFAESKRTTNEVVYVLRKDLDTELFKMSIHSFKCPENLIIII